MASNKDEKKHAVVVTDVRPSAPRATDIGVKAPHHMAPPSAAAEASETPSAAPLATEAPVSPSPPQAESAPPVAIPTALVDGILALPEDMSSALHVKDYVRWLDLRLQLLAQPNLEALETFLGLQEDLSHHVCYSKWLELRNAAKAVLGR